MTLYRRRRSAAFNIFMLWLAQPMLISGCSANRMMTTEGYAFSQQNAAAVKVGDTEASVRTTLGVPEQLYTCSNGEFGLFYRHTQTQDEGLDGGMFLTISRYSRAVKSAEIRVYLDGQSRQVTRVTSSIQGTPPTWYQSDSTAEKP